MVCYGVSFTFVLVNLLGVFTKLQKVIISFILSSCWHGATGFSLNGFL